MTKETPMPNARARASLVIRHCSLIRHYGLEISHWRRDGCIAVLPACGGPDSLGATALATLCQLEIVKAVNNGIVATIHGLTLLRPDPFVTLLNAGKGSVNQMSMNHRRG
jgi:hypothetical protein